MSKVRLGSEIYGELSEEILSFGANGNAANRSENFEGVEHRVAVKGAVGGALKRSVDIAFSLLALLTFLVPMLVIAVTLKLLSPGPITFAHERVGLRGRKFGCLKFRTMVVDAEERLQAHLNRNPEAAAEFASTRKLKDDPRIIPIIGGFLRKTSLDELPQFFNVLLGDMSIVGPRPVTESEIREFYGLNHPYMRARPGITGLWQVSGRNSLTYPERVALDARYVENWRFSGDLAIFMKTIPVVFKDCNGL